MSQNNINSNQNISDQDEQIFDNQFQNLDFQEQISKHNQQIQYKFNEIAKQNNQDLQPPKITPDQAIQLVEDTTELININCDMAKPYYYETHEDFEQNFGSNKKENVFLDYEKFIQILSLALEEQQKYEKQNQSQNQQQENSLDNNQNENNDFNNNTDQYQINDNQNPSLQPEPYSQQNQQNTHQQQPEVHYDQDPSTNIYTKHNNMIYGNFIHNFNKDIYQYFSDFSKETQNGEPLVKAQDIPLIMRVAFYIDNITFHKNKTDQEEFFNKEDSYKIVLVQIDRYLQTQQKIDSESTDITQYQFQFHQFLDFIEYFIQNEPDIFLKRSENDENFEETQIQNDASISKDTQESALELELRNNIQKYEQMLEQCESQNERIVISNMIQSLYDQLNKLQIVKQPVPVNKSYIKRKQLTKEENRKKNLNEIFLFYCRQQYTQAPKYSFDRILYECHTMNLSNFLLFAKQFKINNYCLKLTKKMLPGLFKKVSNNYKDLTFQEFQIVLEKIALIMFEDKDELPTEFDKIEALYKYIGVDDVNQIRKHMHILNPPFNIQDPIGFRHLPKDKDRNIELKKIPGKLALELEKRKKERELLVKKFTSMPQQVTKQSNYQPNYSKNNYYQDDTNNNQSQNNGSISVKNNQNNSVIQSNYAQKNMIKQQNKINVENKVSWQQLGQIDYKDMKTLQNKQQQQQFKPTDLFQDRPDNDDKLYLQQYDLQEENQKKQEQSYLHRKEQEHYGQIKNNLRPTQKYLLKQDPYGNANTRYNQPYDHQPSNNNNNNIYQSQNQQYNNNNQQQQQQNVYFSNPSLRKQNISQSYLQRANQIDNEEKIKQNNQIQSLAYQNEKNIQRGLYTLSK